MKFLKLNQAGFDHLIALVVVLVAVGAVGTYLLVGSKAATSVSITQQSSAATSDLNRIQNYRSSKGYYALTEKSCVDQVANDRAKYMANTYKGSWNNILEPTNSWIDNEMASRCPGHYWTSFSTNSGPGNDESSVFTAFLDQDCDHLGNVAVHAALHNSFTATSPNGQLHCSYAHSWHPFYVGTGVWKAGSTYYVAQVFVRW